MSEPMTPAGLPRNREADAWRAHAEQAENALWTTRIAVFPLALVCVLLAWAFVAVSGERDAARAQVAAAEQRAERAEEARRITQDGVAMQLARALEGNGCRSLAEVGRVRREVCTRIDGRIQWVPLFGDQP